MKLSNHFIKRMNSRGISADMVNIAFIYGDEKDDKIILSRKIIKKLLKKHPQNKRILTKIYDKGGIVLICKDDTIITVYTANFNNKRHLVAR